MPKKGAWALSRFNSGLSKKEGVVFLRGGRDGGADTPIRMIDIKKQEPKYYSNKELDKWYSK